MPPGLQPAHKMSIILFLERVYGIPDQETFFRLIEEAFLPGYSLCDYSRHSNHFLSLALFHTIESSHRQQ